MAVVLIIRPRQICWSRNAQIQVARIDLRFIGRFSGADIRIISALAEIIEANQLHFRRINSDHTFLDFSAYLYERDADKGTSFFIIILYATIRI